MGNNTNVQSAYQATQISTATKEQLLLITYDIGIRSCRIAEAALDTDPKTQDLALANQEILRAQEVIRELMVTLNTNKGGEMAQGLMRLYDYMYQLLIEANVKKEPGNVTIVREMMEDLKSTWEEALLKLLKEYQDAHPEDEEFRNAISEMEKASSKAPSTPKAAQPQPRPGGLNIAG
ncbi:MAG: flagellar export chaperone FliS [Fretibacterium sp.]|nr:flagellar export chaperone FliS [Fretibacterium sp.]